MKKKKKVAVKLYPPPTPPSLPSLSPSLPLSLSVTHARTHPRTHPSHPHSHEEKNTGSPAQLFQRDLQGTGDRGLPEETLLAYA